MLLGADAKPVAPSHIQSRLAQIHPSLFLKWCDGVGGAWWGVMAKWEPTDPRHKYIQAGEMSPDEDADMVAMLPPDCPADEAYGWVVNGLKLHADKAHYRQMLDRAHEYNRQRQDDAFEAAHEDALNKIELRGHRLFEDTLGAIPKVGGAASARSRRKAE